MFVKNQRGKEKGVNVKPTIKSISPEFFLESYKKQLEKFENVICIVSSAKLSDNYISALKAKEQLPLEQRENVYVINSQHISAGQSLAVLEALDLIQEQRKIKEVIKRLEAAIPISIFGHIGKITMVERQT